MKKNNKGFMLVEALIMSMVIVGVLVAMYIMFQNVSNSYDKSFSYNTVTGLYVTNEVRNYLSDNNLESLEKSVAKSTSKYVIVPCSSIDTLSELCNKGNIKTILLTDESLSGLKGKRVSDTNISEKMYDFINYLKVDKDNNMYRIIIEFNDETYASIEVPSLVSLVQVDLLNNSLTPVVYDETANNGAGSWVIADTTKQWYNYDQQEWANAVILNSGVSTTPGTVIDVETQTKAMYVWIPRYEYKIDGTYGTHTDGTAGTESLPGAIDVKFINSSQTTADNGYILHPSFTWDTNDDGSITADEHLDGIWVGKFETTGSATSPTILPNNKSLARQNVSPQFTTAQVFGTYLNNSNNTDAHMMKNSEWGAVAYLSQSIYGKYGNDDYTGANKEVYKNDSSDTYTGKSSGVPPADGYSTGTCSYNDITDRGSGTGSCGGGASTTGNIYGIYDMSGGAMEYVMGYLTIANSNYENNPENYFGWTNSDNQAEFTYKPADKYFDAYTSEDSSTGCNGGICYGHALSETNYWYNDMPGFVNFEMPWSMRGGDYGRYEDAGVFFSLSDLGSGSIDKSFRSVILSVSNSSADLEEEVSNVTIAIDTSGASTPNLLNNSLTPVVYDETANDGDGSWIIADTTKPWYNYGEHIWANAVILNSGVSTTPGTVIDVETQAKAMYVWVPRYEYKIEGTYGTHTDGTAGTQALPGAIDIKFISSSQTTADTGYILHPAFTWGVTEISGMWVGKFETTGGETSPTILPYTSPLEGLNIYEQHSVSSKFEYYLSNPSNANSHMMKVSEWGAVAYLSQSIYGKYGNSMYTGANREIYVNNCYWYTGGSSGTPNGKLIAFLELPSCSYDDISDRGNGTGSCGGGASTTGNIYGVYDMSGGEFEVLMGYYTKANKNYESNPGEYFGATATINYSGFTRILTGKYYDNYTSTSMSMACNGGICYGHALSETAGWYYDFQEYIDSGYPWVMAGGINYYNTNTNIGIFSLDSMDGRAESLTFRAVLLTTGA